LVYPEKHPIDLSRDSNLRVITLHVGQAPIGDNSAALSKVVRSQLSYDNPVGGEPNALIIKIEPTCSWSTGIPETIRVCIKI
jgi:hypothetical protein